MDHLSASVLVVLQAKKQQASIKTSSSWGAAGIDPRSPDPLFYFTFIPASL
jgi:hypothetical protein